MSSLILPQTVGPASFPLKQNINNNLTNARMGLPFKPDTMIQGNDFAAGRSAYIQNVGVNPIDNNSKVNTQSTVTTYTNRPIRFGVSNSNPAAQNGAGKKKNYNVCSSQRTYLMKINAIGKSSTNTVNTVAMSYSGVDQTSVKDALVRARRAGCVAPPKKGASRTSTSGYIYGSNSNG